MKEIFGYVYCITNSLNNMKYIGQTTQKIDLRWSQHKTEGRCGKIKTYLYHSMRKYGVDHFIFEELDVAYSREELDSKEIEYIATYETLHPNGYNLTSGGFAFNHSDESRRRMREAISKRDKSLIRRGFKLSDEVKLKLSLAKLGKKSTPEQVEARSKGIRTFYENLRKDPEAYEAFVAKKRDTSHLHTDEVHKKASMARTGKPFKATKERNQKISNTLKEKGHKPSKECTEKANLSRLGTHHSEESKRKMSESLKGKKAHNKLYFTEEQIQEILSLRAEGLTLQKIAEKFGVTKTVITRILKESLPKQL